MTEAEAEKLVTSLESGHEGIENFLALSADDRATVMALLEGRDANNELRQVLKQSEGNLTRTVERK
jgi:hypothetical protein